MARAKQVISSKRGKGPNPLRIDPTRTASLRRAFERAVKARFARLRLKLWTLLVDEDSLGLMPPTDLHPTFQAMRAANQSLVNCGGPGSGVPGPCPSGTAAETKGGSSAPPAPKGSKLKEFHTKGPKDSPHTYDDIDKAVDEISSMPPGELKTYVEGLFGKGTPSAKGSKIRVLSEVKRRMKERLGSYERTQFRNVANAGRWQFSSDPDKVKAFKAWLKLQLAQDIISKSDRDLWEAYTKEGLKKGAGRAFDDTRRPQKLKDKLAERMDFYEGTRDEFLRSAFNRPVAVEKVELLASRAFDELDDITTTMATRMTRHLTDGLVQGRGPRDIARDLDNDLDIGRGRALVIARTEIIRAHAEGQLMALEELGVEEVGVAVEWSTTGDDKVCELCQPLEGVVLKLDEAKGMLPRHPNCRCAWIPANVGEDDKGQKDTQKSIERALGVSVEREGGFDLSRWVGADLTPAAARPQSILGNEDYLANFSKAFGRIKGDCGC